MEKRKELKIRINTKKIVIVRKTMIGSVSMFTATANGKNEQYQPVIFFTHCSFTKLNILSSLSILLFHCCDYNYHYYLLNDNNKEEHFINILRRSNLLIRFTDALCCKRVSMGLTVSRKTAKICSH